MDTPSPSVFSHEILNANPYAFLDDAPLEERRARAVELRQILPDSVLENAGALSSEAILQVRQQAWPDIRNADELHDALQTLIAFPEHEAYRAYFQELINWRRAGETQIGDKKFWWAAERHAHFMAIYHSPDSLELVNTAIPGQRELTLRDGGLKGENRNSPPSFRAIGFANAQDINKNSSSRPWAGIAVANAETIHMIRGWMFHSGPTTAQILSEKLRLSLAQVNHAFIELEASGVILRGKFSPGFGCGFTMV